MYYSARFWLVLYAVSAMSLAACVGDEPAAPALGIEVHDVDVGYVRGDSVRSLRFEMTLTNATSAPQLVYAFAYATNEDVDPPARAVYPPKVLQSMPPNRRFAFATPTVGVEKRIAAGESVPFVGILVLPRRWHDGRPIETSDFTRLSLFLYNREGRRVFEKGWPLIP